MEKFIIVPVKYFSAEKKKINDLKKQLDPNSRNYVKGRLNGKIEALDDLLKNSEQWC